MTKAELKLWAEFHRDKRFVGANRKRAAEECLFLIETGRPDLMRIAEAWMDNWFRPPGVPPREETV